MESDQSPRLALEQAAHAHAILSQRARAPVWYHPALGLLVGGLVAAQAAPAGLSLFYLPVFSLGLVLLVRTYQRRTGLWISGYRRGRTRLVAVSAAALTLAIMLGGVYLRFEGGFVWAPLAAAPLAAALVTWAGFVWERAYRADLTAEGTVGSMS
jgi:hypothetical protein